MVGTTVLYVLKARLADQNITGSIDTHVDGIAVSQGSFKSIGPRSLLTSARVALAE